MTQQPQVMFKNSAQCWPCGRSIPPIQEPRQTGDSSQQELFAGDSHSHAVDHKSHTVDVLRTPQRERAAAEASCRKEIHNERQTDQSMIDHRGSHNAAITRRTPAHKTALVLRHANAPHHSVEQDHKAVERLHACSARLPILLGSAPYACGQERHAGDAHEPTGRHADRVPNARGTGRGRRGRGHIK